MSENYAAIARNQVHKAQKHKNVLGEEPCRHPEKCIILRHFFFSAYFMMKFLLVFGPSSEKSVEKALLLNEYFRCFRNSESGLNNKYDRTTGPGTGILH